MDIEKNPFWMLDAISEDRYRDVIACRFGDRQLTLKATGQTIRPPVNTERARQMQNIALSMLRRHLRKLGCDRMTSWERELIDLYDGH